MSAYRIETQYSLTHYSGSNCVVEARTALQGSSETDRFSDVKCITKVLVGRFDYENAQRLVRLLNEASTAFETRI